TFQHTTAFVGPLPPPEALERYEQLHSGFANRLLTLTETEAIHRRGQEKKVLWMNFVLSGLGIVSALASVGSVIWLCYFALQLGYDNAAKTIAISVLVSIAAVFLYRNRSRSKDA